MLSGQHEACPEPCSWLVGRTHITRAGSWEKKAAPLQSTIVFPSSHQDQQFNRGCHPFACIAELTVATTLPSALWPGVLIIRGSQQPRSCPHYISTLPYGGLLHLGIRWGPGPVSLIHPWLSSKKPRGHFQQFHPANACFRVDDCRPTWCKLVGERRGTGGGCHATEKLIHTPWMVLRCV